VNVFGLLYQYFVNFCLKNVRETEVSRGYPGINTRGFRELLYNLTDSAGDGLVRWNSHPLWNQGLTLRVCCIDCNCCQASGGLS
ncbi:hypothetical protein, partial [Microseira wollei]|uniref:hypothetical protein n=1 Tax=Microseira wollei TaxID=467598 RepID=UPI001CFE27A4